MSEVTPEKRIEGIWSGHVQGTNRGKILVRIERDANGLAAKDEFELDGTPGIKCSITCVFSQTLSDDDLAAALTHLPRDMRKASEDVHTSLPPYGHGVFGQTYIYDSESKRWQAARYLP
jgi:hypothetical protein